MNDIWNILTHDEKCEMHKAVENLGYNVSGVMVYYKQVGYRRYRVKLSKKVIGVYDLIKHTFVD